MDDVPSPARPDGSGPGGSADLSPRARQLKERLLGEFSLSVDDVAGILEVDRSTVYRYIQDGALAALKIGREYRLSDADVESFLQALIARERQRVAELRVRALMGAGGPSGPAAVPAAVPPVHAAIPATQTAASEPAAVVEPAPAEPTEGGDARMGPMAVGLQDCAARQARRTGHREVRPAHVLLALISDQDCILWDRPFPERMPLRAAMARQALDRIGADVDSLRTAVQATLPSPDEEPGKGPPNREMGGVFHTVWGAAREAMGSLGRRWLGTDAILLALYGQADLAAALRGAGAEESRLRAELQRMAGTLAADDGRPRFSELARHAGRVAAAGALGRRARTIEPEDLLLALLEDTEAARDGLAQRALGAVGADLAAIRAWAEARLGAAPEGAPEPDPGTVPLQPNPGLRTVVDERAPTAARGLGHAAVGTEHLLLGLYSIPEIADRMEQAHAPHGEVRGAIRRLAPSGAPRHTETRPMFGRYSQRAQRVIVLAQEESRRRGTGSVGTGHLMLSLLREGSGIAPKALRSLGLDLDALRQRVEALLPEPRFPGGGPKGEIQFTPHGKSLIMDHASAAARAFGHQYVGTEHLLLGAYDADPRLAKVLEEAGAVREGIEAAVLRLMGGDPKLAALPVPQHPVVGSALDRATKRARGLGHAAIQPAHLLLGLLDVRGGGARAVLERLHVDLGVLEASVAVTLPKGRQARAAALLPAADDGQENVRVGLSPESQDVMVRAASAAAEAGAPRIGTEHLLLGLYAQPNSEVAQLLTAAGAPADAVAVEVSRVGVEHRGDAEEG